MTQRIDCTATQDPDKSTGASTAWLATGAPGIPSIWGLCTMGRGNRVPKHRPAIVHDPFCVSMAREGHTIAEHGVDLRRLRWNGPLRVQSMADLQLCPCCTEVPWESSPIADSQQCARDSALDLGASSICGMQIWTCLDFGIGATAGVPPEKSEKQSQMTCGMPSQSPLSSPDVYFYLGAGPRRIWWITPRQSPGFPIQAVP